MIKIVTIVGARPQFIKAAAISRVIKNEFSQDITEILVHTGQHYDANMSEVFFDELDIPRPKYNLEISGGQHGEMTGRMLEAVEKVLREERPNWVLIYGDTNSTLAGALAAVKLHIPVAHIEAGLRSFNMRMPEEVNRIVSDRISTLLFCPTKTAVQNLKNEGIVAGVCDVGDVMYDVALFYREQAKSQTTVLTDMGLTIGGFALATCHRAENTDDPKRLAEIVTALADVAKQMKVVFPLHPRTRKLILDNSLTEKLGSVHVVDPIPFLDMVALEQAARIILTDSGGVQKEAFFYGVPCVTMRDETEWVETVTLGWNRLVGASAKLITAAVSEMVEAEKIVVQTSPYGRGDSARKIVAKIVNFGK